MFCIDYFITRRPGPGVVATRACAALTAMAVLLGGCATPADPRADAKLPSYASATDRPSSMS